MAQSSDPKPIDALIAFAEIMLKTLKVHNSHIMTNAVAVAALVQALDDEHSQLGERYEKHRAANSTNAPIVATARDIDAQIDKWLATLPAWKRAFS